MNTPDNNNLFDIINLASLIIGMQNLRENREQSAHNDVQVANAEQAQYLLTEITRQFERQNQQLTEILQTLKIVLQKVQELTDKELSNEQET
jgi:hypothetical protein